ncbi:2OG-Fe(II) oxygenase [Salipiger marinus]|jgi:PKHD-type hydroxylase|uniref:2OG-Fe(II) oxygenase n=1 Tax=Salipiger marinus TaxID=555512 RepID=UPI000E9478E8|nr:2OG-Fe(II) oxygenase [Salipiger manganoxidans]MEB3417278.1 2OG-Fe(II) oxygenase [Salipiger manganoxidans]HBM58955.1 oxidoreductase [Citreicella sp.]|tara:strand:- start:25 stop:576 length:552 start_codon:yes stop_codon:yes gene_type:complete
MITVHSIPDAFSETDCSRLIEIARGAEASDARLVGQQRAHNLRRADLVWLDDVPETGWVMDRIIELVRQANRDTYGFDLDAFDESAQVARYGAEREGHFDWHSDVGEGRLASRRKLTMVVQLSEPDAYEGGGLEVMPSSHVVTAVRSRGQATLFPSYLLHRVTPVTGGERFSLTIWAHGPAFR